MADRVTPGPRGAVLHTGLAAAFGFLAAGVFAAAAEPSRGAQLLAAALLIGTLGLPHGALDVRLGRQLLHPRIGRQWLAPFCAAYLTVAALVVLAWWLLPVLALSLFLAASVQHFGSGDRSALRGSASASAEVLLRGSLPVLAPLLFHPGESAALLALLLPARYESALGPAMRAAGSVAVPFYAALLALGVVALVRRAQRERRPESLWVGLEVACLGCLFAAAPPLLAFALYFCVWHAPRHMMAVLGEGGPIRARRIARSTRQAVAPTLAALALGGLGFVFLAREVSTEAALARVLFVGLAALTAPHMLLGALPGPRASSRVLRPTAPVPRRPAPPLPAPRRAA